MNCGSRQEYVFGEGDLAWRPSSNAQNGTTPKTVRTDIGQVRIDVPRDRAGSFETAVLPKHVRRLGGFNEAAVSLDAKGDVGPGAHTCAHPSVGSGSKEDDPWTRRSTSSWQPGRSTSSPWQPAR